MRPRKLILGSGVTAGLAANLLRDSHNICMAWLRHAQASPIPELLPRRAFFDALGVTQADEAVAIADVAPRVEEVVWVDRGTLVTRKLVSTDAFLVYEKGRLTAWLRERAMAAGIEAIVLDTPNQTVDPGGYDLVLDCRGSHAVFEDSGYEITPLAPTLTRCTYAILNRPESIAADQIVFWSLPMRDKAQRMFFCIPVGDGLMSVGCSYSPTLRMDVDAVLEVAHGVGLPVTAGQIRSAGEAAPHRVSAKARDPRVIPIGDAARSCCPMTEYGTMAALSHLLQLCHEPALPASALMRPIHCQIDPHIPLELFL